MMAAPLFLMKEANMLANTKTCESLIFIIGMIVVFVWFSLDTNEIL